MSYIINNSRGEIVAVVGDGTVNTTSTDLSLIGRAVTNYGEYQNENYVYLLENFAASGGPAQPILGQLWYNSSTDVISAYNSANVWVALASQDYVQAQKISPAFTGTPTAPTATSTTNTTQIATTAFVQQNKLSPAFSGVPTAPTAPNATSNTQIATTAFVQNQLINGFSATGTVSAAAFSTVGSISAVGNIAGGNITSGNIITLGIFSAAGSLTGGNLITGGNVTVGGIVNATGNLTTTSQVVSAGNITGGNIATPGTVSAGGNITGLYLTIVGDAQVDGSLNISTEITTPNLAAANVYGILHSGQAVSVTGNITGGTIIANNIIANSITSSGTTPFRIPNLTQAQISALTPQNGDLVYNTTTGYALVYQQGSWVQITIARYN
jgi:hypothetical protein